MKSLHRCLGQRAKLGRTCGNFLEMSGGWKGAMCHNALWEKAPLVRACPAFSAISPVETNERL